jgi:hypothetical protein
MNRLYLNPQIFWHRGAIGLVICVQIVSKGFAFRIKNDYDLSVRKVRIKPADHTHYAFNSARRVAAS